MNNSHDQRTQSFIIRITLTDTQSSQKIARIQVKWTRQCTALRASKINSKAFSLTQFSSQKRPIKVLKMIWICKWAFNRAMKIIKTKIIIRRIKEY